MKQPRITVVGSVNVDMAVKSTRLPVPGETVTGGQFIMAAGGKGANQAVASARLGADVTLIAKVGQDSFGDQAIADFRREGIRTGWILRDPEYPTGVALILIDEQGENLISVASGANHRLTPEEVERSADQICTANVLMLQLEIPIETVCRAAQITSNFYVTHQWLRELKRRGRKPIVGVYFRISDQELVWIGRYNQLHRKMTAASATAEFWGTDSRDGWEVIIPRRIAAKEICRVRSLPQVIGWRYYPGANGKLPCCGCKYCTRGEYGARRLRRRIGVSE